MSKPAPTLESLPPDDQIEEAQGRLADLSEWLRCRCAFLHEAADMVDQALHDLNTYMETM